MISKNAQVYVSVITLSIIVYFKCIFFGITNSDDQVLIGNLPVLSAFSKILRVFSTDAFYRVKSIDLYRPLQSLTFILDAQWGVNTVLVVHISNIVLHILSCLAVYNLLMRLDFRESLAFTGALVYAVHYLFMTAVAWIPARGDLLLALCTFLALLTLIKSLEQSTWRTITTHLTLFTLALLAKETGVLLPFLFAAYLWAYGKFPQLTRKHLLLPLYYLAAIGLYWLMKDASVSSSDGKLGLTQVVGNIHQLPEMVTKFYLPFNMSTLPAYRLSTTLIGIVIISALALLHLYCKKLQQRQTLFYAVWFLLFILPGMTYYPVFYSFCNEHIDHRSYLICFGLLTVNLSVLQQFTLDRHRYFKVGVIVVLGYLSVFNIYFSQNYRNPSAFALQAITMGSSSAKAYANYGTEMFLQGNESEALVYLDKALHMYDKLMPALNYRARIFANRGMYPEALADLDNIILNVPGYYVDAYLLRGILRTELKDLAGAEIDLGTALRIEPALVDTRVAIGRLRHLQGRLKEACFAWDYGAKEGNSDAVELIEKYCR